MFFFDNEEKEAPVLAPPLYHLIQLEVFENTREIFIGEEIDGSFGNWFTLVMRRLESQSNDMITIWLNTPGGDMEAMMVFHDMVRQSPCPIKIIGIGSVASAGCLMLASGDYRIVSESLCLMWHEWSQDVGGGGRYSELKDRRTYEDWSTKYWFKLMARHTGKDPKFWANLTNRKAEAWYMGGESIIEAGFADDLLTTETRAKVIAEKR